MTFSLMRTAFSGLDKRPAYILVLHEAHAVGDAALPGVAERGVEAGVGHAYDDIRLHGVLESEEGARALARGVDAAAVDDGVRARKVDELKDALGALAAAVAAVGFYAVAGYGDNLARLHVAQEPGAYGVEGAALAGYGPAVVKLAYAQWAEAEGVARGDELARGHDREGIRALEVVHGGTYGLLNGAGAQALAGYDVADDLAVRGAGEDGAVKLQLCAQLAGVGEVAVVREGHAALDVAYDYGLRVLARAPSGGAVAAVADCHLAGGQVPHDLGREHLVHEADVLVAGDDAVVVDGHAAALLAAVLQRVERAVGHGYDVLAGAGYDAEYAALLVQLVKDKFSLHSRFTRR